MKRINCAKRPMWMRFSAVAVALAMLMCIFAGCEKKKELDPLEFLKTAFENTVNTATAQTTVTEVGDFSGSIEVVANLTEIEMLKAQLAGLEGLGLEASAKVYLDTAKEAAGLEVGMGGSGIQVIDAFLFLDKSNLALEVGGLFINEAYGIKFDQIEKNFDSSIFGPDGAYSLGFSYDELMDMLGEASAMLADVPAIDEDHAAKAEAVVDEMIDTLLKSVEENCEVTKEDGSVKLDGTEVATTDVIIVLDAVALVEILEDMSTYFAENEEIREIVEYGFDIISGYGVNLEFGSVDEVYETFDEFLAEIDDLKADAAEEEGEIEFVFHVNADKNEFIGISMETVDMEGHVDMELLWGPSVEEFNTVSLVVDVDGEKTEALFTIDEENTDSEYSATVAFEVNSDYEEIAVIGGVEWDKQSGDAAVFMEVDGEELRVEANIKTEDEKTTVALGKIAVPYEEPVDLTGIYINIDTNDPIPAVGNYKDLLTMTEADFEELLDVFSGLAEMFS